MKSAAASARPVLGPAPIATRVVKFGQRPRRAPRRELSAPVGRVPRVARLLALAHRIDGMIRTGELRDWAEAARLVGVTRARMTQIANLLLLAPSLQEAILDLVPTHGGREFITERHLRSTLKVSSWDEQRRLWPWCADNHRVAMH